MNDFKYYLETTGEIGHIIGLNHYVAYVSGLPGLKLGELIVTETKKIGMVHGLDRNVAEILVFNPENLKVGEKAAKTNHSLQIPVNKALLGRIINPLGNPVDGLGPILGEKQNLPIFRKAPGIDKRIRINRPLETGVIIVDMLIPIGYGQRELVIGDPKTGKTTFLLQTITNQAKKGVTCIYVGIGKETSAIKAVESYLKKAKVFENTIMVISTPEDPSTVNYIAPFSGMAIAEYFRDLGNDALIIFDDLTSHAKFYREISLLIKRLPGRSAYPGDIFHIQAALVERAGNIKGPNGKEVSITALPVAETLENDISGFIQTNLMAMTDGHIFFDINEFRAGKFPAINSFLSVSRVGNQTKEFIDRELASWTRKVLSEYKRVTEIAQFGEELSTETLKLLNLGAKIEILFSQDAQTIIPRSLQLLLFGLLIYGFWDNKPQNIMKLEVDTLIENSQQIIPQNEHKILAVKNLEELKKITNELIPLIQKILYQPL